MEDEGAGGIGGGKRLLCAGEQRGVVALELERVMGAACAHRRGHARMAMQRVGDDDATFEDHAFERLERRRHLVAALGVPLASDSRVSASHTLTISGGML